MRRIVELLSLVVSFGICACSARAELSQPNAAGVAMGHLHYVVRDVAANKAFWVALGGRSVLFNGTTEGIVFPDVVVLLRQGEPNGGTQGSVVNHVAFRVKSVAAIENAGFEVEYNEQYPGVASVHTPEGERIELFDDGLATNLGFTIDGGGSDAAAERHNRKLEVPIIAHHIHLNVPAEQVAAAKEWYATHFGGVRGKRWRYDAVDLHGININISAVDTAQAPTRGRMLDHIGFEVTNLEAFCKTLEAKGIEFDRPYGTLPSGFGLAFLTDPWGTYIELTEGLRDL
jgi:catechol 2,3-dioxygenase-like lactoylglutathione lyase family enzyme